MYKKKLPSQKELREYFDYDKYTGRLAWKKKVDKKSVVKIGDEAGSINNGGYRCVQFKNKQYVVHRIIWKLHYGEDPDTIDHINHIVDDNRICNLRNVTDQLNAYNQVQPHKHNKLGILGVSWNKQNKKYRAQITISGKYKHLGYFDCPLMGALAYQRAKKERDKILNQFTKQSSNLNTNN